MNGFVHLHTHSLFSTLDGVASPADYFQVAAERKYPALAITEHGNLASVPDAYFASLQTGVKYICGSELYYNDDEPKRKLMMEEQGISSHKMSDDDKRRYSHNRHLLVLCKNMDGYRNLLKLKELSYEGFFRKPRASSDMVSKCKDGLIICSGCMNGPISFELLQNIEKQNKGGYSDELCNKYYNNAIEIATKYKNLLGEDFYIELQMPGIENDVKLFELLLKISKDVGIKCVLTNDAHYIQEKDYRIQRIMMAIDQDLTIDSPDLFITDSKSGYFKTRDELEKTFKDKYTSKSVTLVDFNRVCDNTLEIADKCESFKPDLSLKLPQIDDADNTLTRLVAGGLKEKGKAGNKEYIDRAKHELERIKEKEFSSYFLICRDLVMQSKKLGMPVGPRGSAGGSLVCYLIGIHDIDAVYWKTSFDRMLSTSRGGKLLQVNMDNDKLIEEEV